MKDIINIIIGYDEREAVAYHTCVESLVSNSSRHLNVTPLLTNASKHDFNITRNRR